MTKILIVEHEASDIELIQRELRKGNVNYVAEVVANRTDYEEALSNFKPNIILSDYTLPSFSGLEAFEIRERLAPRTPFVFVSGTIGEENSVELIKNGVTDYAFKDSLYTLNTKVKRALHETEERQKKIQAESELKLSERRLSRAQQLAHMGSWEMDYDTGVALWSDQACRIYGLSVSDNHQSLESWLSYTHPDELDSVLKKVMAAYDSLHETSFHRRILRRDGTIRHIYCETKFEFDTSGNPALLLGIEHDVTELEQTRESLQRTEMNINAILENSDSGFLLLDKQSNIIAFNTQANFFAEQAFGISLNENPRFVDLAGNGTGEELTSLFEKVIPGEHVSRESFYRQSDGSISWYQVSGNPVKAPDGKITGACIAFRDITSRKRIENEIKQLNEHLEEQVRERTSELSEANKALEAFSYSVSHDLRTPLRAMVGFSKVIQRDYAGKMDPGMRELLELIDSSGKRMTDIIEDLLKLAKYGRENLKPVPVNMTRLIKGVWANLGRILQHNARLDLEELPVIRADRSMMEQAVINLLSNAIKYSSKKEKPLVVVSSHQTPESTTFYFRDNGAGFDMKHYDRLFGAFQRLHGQQEFEGTGVGLALVKRIIERHGGIIGAKAAIDAGATFYFTLPSVASARN